MGWLPDAIAEKTAVAPSALVWLGKRIRKRLPPPWSAQNERPRKI